MYNMLLDSDTIGDVDQLQLNESLLLISDTVLKDLYFYHWHQNHIFDSLADSCVKVIFIEGLQYEYNANKIIDSWYESFTYFDFGTKQLMLFYPGKTHVAASYFSAKKFLDKGSYKHLIKSIKEIEKIPFNSINICKSKSNINIKNRAFINVFKEDYYGKSCFSFILDDGKIDEENYLISGDQKITLDSIIYIIPNLKNILNRNIIITNFTNNDTND